jgi:hypothetical protein
MAVIGLAGQLFDASLAGYNLLETARSFGQDYQDLSLRLEAEKLILQQWAETWVLGQSTDRKINHSHRNYRFAVTTLARISALFAEILEYSSKYGIESMDGSCGPPKRKRDIIPHKISASVRSLLSHPLPKNLTPTRSKSGLDTDSIKLLSNPALLGSEQIRPDLEEEVNRLKASAKRLQNTLPAKSKLRWSVVDKDKFGELIQQLKEYNEILNRLLPVGPESPQPKGLFYHICSNCRSLRPCQIKLQS